MSEMNREFPPVFDGHEDFMKIVKTDPRYRADTKFVFRTTVMPFEWVQ